MINACSLLSGNVRKYCVLPDATVHEPFRERNPTDQNTVHLELSRSIDRLTLQHRKTEIADLYHLIPPASGTHPDRIGPWCLSRCYAPTRHQSRVIRTVVRAVRVSAVMACVVFPKEWDKVLSAGSAFYEGGVMD